MQKQASPTVAGLLREIDDYLAATGMAVSRFGQNVNGNHKLIPRLRETGRCHVETVDKVRAYIRDHPPRGAA